jgi:hypothetical protein
MSRKVARGSTRRGASGKVYQCMRRCMVAFDDETFEQIRKLAIAQRTTFAQQVRLLTEFGLEGQTLPTPSRGGGG